MTDLTQDIEKVAGYFWSQLPPPSVYEAWSRIRDFVVRKLPQDESEYLSATRGFLGKKVRITLHEKEIRTGRLIGVSNDGEFTLQDDDGTVWFGWPMLKIEEEGADESSST